VFSVVSVGAWLGYALTVAVLDTPWLPLSVKPILIVVAVSGGPVQFHCEPNMFPAVVFAMLVHVPAVVLMFVPHMSYELSVSVTFANTRKVCPVVTLV